MRVIGLVAALGAMFLSAHGAASGQADSGPAATGRSRPITAADIEVWPRQATGAAISADGQWFAYMRADPRDRRSGTRTLFVQAVAGDASFQVPDVLRYAFAGTGDPRLLVLQSRRGGDSPTELVLWSLGQSDRHVIGAASEFSVAPSGDRVAWVDDHGDQASAVLMLHLDHPGRQRLLLSSPRKVRGLQWSANADVVSVYALNASAPDHADAVVSINVDEGHSPRKTFIRPQNSPSFPSGYVVSARRPMRWLSDMSAMVLEIEPSSREEHTGASPRAETSMITWHWKDDATPWQQTMLAPVLSRRSEMIVFGVSSRTVVRLGGESMPRGRQSIPPLSSRWGFVLDSARYRDSNRIQSLSGGVVGDLVAVDLGTGERRLLLEKLFEQRNWIPAYYPSPDGEKVLFWRDADYFVCDVASGNVQRISGSTSTSFVDQLDGRRLGLPIPASGLRADGQSVNLGWSSDSKSVLLHDGWDLWKIAIDSGVGINLTQTDRRSGPQWMQRFIVISQDETARREAGIDLSRPLYVAPFWPRTKEQGIARIDLQNGEVEILRKEAARFDQYRSGRDAILLRNASADVLVYARERFDSPMEFIATDDGFRRQRRLSGDGEERHLQSFAWSAGYRLLDYSCSGQDVQAVLRLPAGYEAGKQYPTIVDVYERRSNNANVFDWSYSPSSNRALFLGAGYAVLLPDIVHVVDDPLVSATNCVLAALEAAFATGVVERESIGLMGESMGGMETNFIITQTDVFKAAVSKSGSASMLDYYQISHLGHMKASLIDNARPGRMSRPLDISSTPEYARNSAILYASQVKTPLLMMHGDQDPNVDWRGSIEFFFALQAAGAPVILLQLRDEGHGVPADPRVERERAERQRLFFDHYLKGAPPPQWIVGGGAER